MKTGNRVLHFYITGIRVIVVSMHEIYVILRSPRDKGLFQNRKSGFTLLQNRDKGPNFKYILINITLLFKITIKHTKTAMMEIKTLNY